MKPLRVDVILAFLFFTALLNACGGGSGNAKSKAAPITPNSANETTNSPNTNVEELGLLVRVPYDAEDIVWKDYASHKKLIAVLRFSTADCERIVADAQNYRKPESVSIQSESWFPDELVAQGDISGDDTLKGISYGANAFLQDPFNEGSIIRVEGTNYFVLQATAK